VCGTMKKIFKSCQTRGGRCPFSVASQFTIFSTRELSRHVVDCSGCIDDGTLKRHGFISRAGIFIAYSIIFLREG
jgi:hypothetical protein